MISTKLKLKYIQNITKIRPKRIKKQKLKKNSISIFLDFSKTFIV